MLVFFLSATKIIQKYQEVMVPPGGGGFSHLGVFACGVLLGGFVVGWLVCLLNTLLISKQEINAVLVFLGVL